MFGYLVASASALTEEEFRQYKATYCGLCRSLKESHGQFSRLTLNYDMTFLIILMESLYEPEISSGESLCIAHPREKRLWKRSIFSDYAADMNLALSYLKCLDDWHDDASLLSLAEAKALKKSYTEISAKYPRQCAAMEQSISRLDDIEQRREENPDEAAECFGHLMGSIFVFDDKDRWSECLYGLGDGLGRFIYLMDACMDLENDALKGSYNPFRRYYGLNNEERFRDILKIYLADAIAYYDYLPLVQYSGLLKNILCSGLWSQFDRKFKRES